MRMILITGLAVILSLTCFSGCDKEDKVINRNGKKIVYEKTYDIYSPIENFRTLNPAVSLDKGSFYFDKLVYDSMYRPGKNMEPERVLAESEIFDKDSVTIKLKNNVKWHDGTNLGANDIKFTVSCYKEGEGYYKALAEKIESVRVLSDDTVKITFKSKYDGDLSNLIFPILPRHNFKSVAGAVKADREFVPMGTGRYRVKSFDFVRGIVLEGFDNYHTGEVPVNRIHFQVLPSNDDAINMMGIESMSMMFSESQDRESIFSNRDVKIKDFCSNTFEVMGFNTKGEITGNVDVRKAVAYGIDTNELIKKAYYGNGVINKDIYFPNYLGNSDKDSRHPMFEQNENRAKKYLNNAGYHDIDKDGIMENPLNKKLKVKIIVSSENPTRMVAAKIIAEQLKKIKMDAIVEQLSGEDFSSRLVSGDYDIFIGGYAIQPNYDMRFLLHSDYENPAQYKNKKMDTLLNSIQGCRDIESKRSDYSKISTILRRDVPYYCLMYRTYGAVSAKNTSDNIKPHAFDYYRNCDEWYCLFPKK